MTGEAPPTTHQERTVYVVRVVDGEQYQFSDRKKAVSQVQTLLREASSIVMYHEDLVLNDDTGEFCGGITWHTDTTRQDDGLVDPSGRG